MNSTRTALHLHPISDYETGCDRVGALPLTDPSQACIETAAILQTLIKAPLDPVEMFHLLEQIRPVVTFLAEELSRRYTHCPIPLPRAEEEIFGNVVTLWKLLIEAYQKCREPGAEEAQDRHLVRLAQSIHRAIQLTGLLIYEHERTRRELPEGIWHQLHGYYQQAEELDIDSLPISDMMEPLGRGTYCSAAYCAILLRELANPYSLTHHELHLVQRWAGFWAPLVSLHGITAHETLPDYLIDLGADHAMCPRADCLRSENSRRMDTTALSEQMEMIRQQLRQRIPPAQLSLGADCTSGQCLQLLDILHRPWSQVHSPRRFKRHATTGVTHIASGFEAIYYFISGHLFKQPNADSMYSRQEYETLFAFRFQENPSQPLHIKAEPQPLQPELWDLINQSANGFRLTRRLSGEPISHGQLLAICPDGNTQFVLGKITWLQQEHGEGLTTGIMAMAGTPKPVAVRPVDVHGKVTTPFRPAFLLPGSAILHSSDSLILPKGSYHWNSELEISFDKTFRVKCKSILEEGSDYEQISFDMVT